MREPLRPCWDHSGLQSFTLAIVSVSPPASMQSGSVEGQPPCESQFLAGLTVVPYSQESPDSCAPRLLGLTGSCIRQANKPEDLPQGPLLANKQMIVSLMSCCLLLLAQAVCPSALHSLTHSLLGSKMLVFLQGQCSNP